MGVLVSQFPLTFNLVQNILRKSTTTSRVLSKLLELLLNILTPVIKLIFLQTLYAELCCYLYININCW